MDLLPHNRKTLTNYLASAYLLLLSTVADLLTLLFPASNAFVDALSAGAFLANLAPFIEVRMRYTRTLSWDFQVWESRF